MTLRIVVATLALAATTALFPALASAECSTADSGARCIRVVPPARPTQFVEPAAMRGTSASTPLVHVGEVVPRGEYSIIMNAEYYGLPPVSDGWVYMRVGQDAYRVDWRTHQVLERVTEQAAANF